MDHDIVAGQTSNYLRAVLESQDDSYHVAVVRGAHGSALLTSMASPSALLVVREGVTQVGAGERLQAQMLDWLEEVAL